MNITSLANNSSFTLSRTMNITWETDSTCYKVNIKLMKGDITIMDIGSVRNKGLFSWDIPSSIRPGIDYYFFINATDNSASSNSQTFTIKPKLKQISSYNIPLFLISIILTVAVISKKKLQVKKR